ncbi:hypothetical protein [Georgenia subflava]|uniref:hypothetical protein n=1 Tax=Georgenia subflava TaxID=1622177 RepID=UPI00186AFBA9|nr:hypothetical protein [Georgenia subflava]
MTITPTGLTRAAGLAAVASGLLYVGIQFIHPDDDLATVTGSAWFVVACLTIGMAVLGLAGVTGIYLRQVRETGVLGLVGYLMLSCFYLAVVAFTFVEAFLVPTLATTAPEFTEDFLGIFGGVPADGSLAALETLNPVVGGIYLLAGVAFGIAVFRARVLERWAGVLLAVGSLATLAIPMLPHDAGRFAAVPTGLAVAWLGYSLWSDRRDAGTGTPSDVRGRRLDRAAAE